MKTSELDYQLPKHLIAQQGLTDRAASRLMVLHRAQQRIEHRGFADIADYLGPGDCLVVNESKVVPARFFTQRATGGKVEGLFLQETDGGAWQVLLKNARRVKVGEPLHLCTGDAGEPTETTLTVQQRLGNGRWVLQPDGSADTFALLEAHGVTPLPPYINRQASQDDLTRYQTVYAQSPGSVAAPTAGLHFTDQLLQRLTQSGIKRAQVTLHVGIGTFKPIEAETVESHQMHAEHYQLDERNAALINETIDSGGRIIAVGTTSVRTLETVARDNRVVSGSGATKLFITPGYRFKIVDVLLTNFHLPRTSLLALVCAFGGTQFVLDAYRQAVTEQYRFFSYGDAMLLL